MPAGGPGRFEPASNAQATVEVASRLIVGQRVCQAANDQAQLEPTLASLAPAAGAVQTVLVDRGFVSGAAVVRVEHACPGSVRSSPPRQSTETNSLPAPTATLLLPAQLRRPRAALALAA